MFCYYIMTKTKRGGNYSNKRAKQRRTQKKMKHSIGGKFIAEGAAGKIYTYDKDKDNNDDKENFISFLGDNEATLYIVDEGKVVVYNPYAEQKPAEQKPAEQKPAEQKSAASLLKDLPGKDNYVVKQFKRKEKFDEELIECADVLELYANSETAETTIVKIKLSVNLEENLFGIGIGSYYYIISKKANDNYIADIRQNPKEELPKFTTEILESIKLINDQNQFHNDIKPPNILKTLGVNGKYVLGDWGTKTVIKEENEQVTGIKLDSSKRGDPIFGHPLKMYLTTDPKKTVLGDQFQIRALDLETSKTLHRLKTGKTGARKDWDIFGCNTDEGCSS